MKVIFIKIILFLSIVLLSDYTYGIVMNNLKVIAHQKSPFAMVGEHTMKHVDAEVILIGASETTHGIIPSILEDSLEMTVYNCGRDGYRFLYQSAMINGVLRRYSPKLIVWSASPYFLSHPSKDDVSRLSILNSYSNTDEYVLNLMEYRGHLEKYKLKSNFYKYNSRLLPYLYKVFFSDYEFEEGGFIPLSNLDSKFPAIQYAEIENNLDTSIANLFAETLDKCIDNGTKVLIVFPPRMVISNWSGTAQYKELSHICKERNVSILTKYHNGKDYMSASKYFKDVGHLNRQGASKFTKELSNEVSLYLDEKD